MTMSLNNGNNSNTISKVSFEVYEIVGKFKDNFFKIIVVFLRNTIWTQGLLLFPDKFLCRVNILNIFNF